MCRQILKLIYLLLMWLLFYILYKLRNLSLTSYYSLLNCEFILSLFIDKTLIIFSFILLGIIELTSHSSLFLKTLAEQICEY